MFSILNTAFFFFLFFLFSGYSQAQNFNEQSVQTYQEAIKLAMAGNVYESIPLFKKSFDTDPHNFLAAFDLGGAYESTGDKDNALIFYVKAFEINPKFIEAGNQAGTLYLLHKNEPQKAIGYFKDIFFVKDPYVDSRFTILHTKSQALQNLSVAYALLGQYGLANGIAKGYLNNPQAEQNRSSKMKTMITRTDVDMAESKKRIYASELGAINKLLYGGNPKEALNQYENFEKNHQPSQLTDLDQWDLYSGIGMAHAYLNQIPFSEEYFKKAVNVSNKLDYYLSIESHFNLACSLSLQNKIDEALIEVENVLWKDLITKHDPYYNDPKKYRKSSKLRTDDTLKNVRQDPQFEKLLEKYGV